MVSTIKYTAQLLQASVSRFINSSAIIAPPDAHRFKKDNYCKVRSKNSQIMTNIIFLYSFVSTNILGYTKLQIFDLLNVIMNKIHI